MKKVYVTRSQNPTLLYTLVKQKKPKKVYKIFCDEGELEILCAEFDNFILCDAGTWDANSRFGYYFKKPVAIEDIVQVIKADFDDTGNVVFTYVSEDGSEKETAEVNVAYIKSYLPIQYNVYPCNRGENDNLWKGEKNGG